MSQGECHVSTTSLRDTLVYEQSMASVYMLRLTEKSFAKDVKSATKYLTSLEKKQIPFAKMQAINELAFKTREFEKRVIRRSFDRPTRFTQNATQYDKAKNKRNIKALVYIRDQATKGNAPVKYIYPNVEGGRRNLKSYERLLQARGILPPGMYTVPAKSAPLDRYGNLPKGQITKMLSHLGAARDSAQNTDFTRRRLKSGKLAKRRKRAVYFLKPNVGIFLRSGSGVVQPYLIFTRAPNYKANGFDFYGAANKYVAKNFRRVFDKQLARAIKNAK